MVCIYFETALYDFVSECGDAKYFSSLVKGIVIEDQWLLYYSIFKSETKKDTTLLLVEL